MTHHIVALSGGKDSTALALRLAEVEPRNYEYVITPTGDELPEMIEHWKTLGALLGKPLKIITSGHSLQGLIRKQNALPNWRQRWCTRILKIEPYKQYLSTIAPAISYVGLRADEPDREGIYGDIEDIAFRYPLREWGWGIKEVWTFLNERGVTIPRRTDCARCYGQRIGEWWNLWKDQPDIYIEAEGQEIATGHTFRSPGRDTWPAPLRELREQFEQGKTPRGADIQGDLFGETLERCRACQL